MLDHAGPVRGISCRAACGFLARRGMGAGASPRAAAQTVVQHDFEDGTTQG